MKTIESYKHQRGFIIMPDSKLEEMSLYEYLTDYQSDEKTTPFGLLPNLHVRRGGLCSYDFHYEEGGEIEIWSWGPRGQHPRCQEEGFETMSEAHARILELLETEYSNTSTTEPSFIPENWLNERLKCDIEGITASWPEKEVMPGFYIKTIGDKYITMINTHDGSKSVRITLRAFWEIYISTQRDAT